MRLWDFAGYVAAALVLAAFCMREMVPLRVVALCSNLAFIAYGLALGLVPVWLLHALLLPMNCYRLLEAMRARGASMQQKIEIVPPAAGTGRGPLRWRKVSSMFHRHSLGIAQRARRRAERPTPLGMGSFAQTCTISGHARHSRDRSGASAGTRKVVPRF
jgi:hypothetical protein